MNTTTFAPAARALPLHQAMPVRPASDAGLLCLWRTVALIRADEDDDGHEEVLVFFEGPQDRRRALALLDTLLPVVWAVPPHRLETYNLTSEVELLCLSAGHSSTGDARLFETGGFLDAPTYADPARTQLLVTPATHARLQAAQTAAALLSMGPA